MKVINDIIYNDLTNVVTVFKDYLIYDDISEFLKRFYKDEESFPRLIKIYNFYDKYSKVFPNYIILEENKYMFKNIERKQLAIDERQQFFQDLEEKQNGKQQTKNSNLSQMFENESNQLFDSKFINSVNKIKTNSEISDAFPFDVVSKISDSHLENLQNNEIHNKSIKLDGTYEENNRKSQKESPFKRLEDFKLTELVDKFLSKDTSISESKESDNHPSIESNYITFAIILIFAHIIYSVRKYSNSAT